MTRLKIIAATAGLIVLVFACASLTTGVNRLTSSWDVYYDSWDKENGAISIGVRNSTGKVQQFDPGYLTPEIEDAKGYKYSLQYNGGAETMVPPGGSLLVSFRYSMPANAPAPRLILKTGLLHFRREVVPLASPQPGFSSMLPQIPEDLVLYQQGDVDIRVDRAWWDSSLIILEVAVSNQGGEPVESDVLCEPVLWVVDENTGRNQKTAPYPKYAILYDPTPPVVTDSLGNPSQFGNGNDTRDPAQTTIDSYYPLSHWTVPGYTDAKIYWVFRPTLVDPGHEAFILSTHAFDYHRWMLFFSSTSFRECHTTRLQVSATRPSGDFANDPLLGSP